MYNFTTITQAQKNIVAQVIAQYATIAGNYCDTMLEGIMHGYCDSGILTDSLSVDDAGRLAKYFTAEGIDALSLNTLNNVIVEIDGEALQCNIACALLALATSDTVDFETVVAYMWDTITQQNGFLEHVQITR